MNYLIFLMKSIVYSRIAITINIRFFRQSINGLLAILFHNVQPKKTFTKELAEL